MEKLKLSMDEIGEASGESRPVVYDAIKAGHLDTFLVGRRRFARPAAVKAWIDYLERESNAGRPVVYRGRATERASA
jgi:NAD(P)H-dependent FMN reductase